MVDLLLQTSSALCGQPNSWSHILGGCAHPDMRKTLMYRHDEAHRIMVTAVYNGRKATLLIVADLSTAMT